MKYLIRVGVVVFWAALICGVLYLPEVNFFSREKNSINIFAWGDILEPAVVAEFEKTTGIKVYLNYYSSNEELLVKIKATRGEGYDLIIPSDYTVEYLAKDGLLKKLDHSKCTFFKDLNPILMNHTFDPGNVYSLPLEWEVFGLGIDKTYFEGRMPVPSWDMVFKPHGYKLVMINDPVETILIAGYYLYGPETNKLTNLQLKGVQNLLIDQKKFIEAYADFRGDYFIATKNSPVAVATSSYIWRTMRRFPHIGFIIPQEGSFLSLENIAIPAATKKEDLVYEFLNYIYSPESVATHYETFGFFPPTLNALHLMDLDPIAESIIRSSPEQFKLFYFTKILATQQQMRDLWVEVKAASN
ncbi:MAG TPA: extracellular solute-binding protein [Rhabdochlamydiaceae bacterium]